MRNEGERRAQARRSPVTSLVPLDRVVPVADGRLGGPEELPAAAEDELLLGPEVPAPDRLRAPVGGAVVLVGPELVLQVLAVVVVAGQDVDRRPGPRGRGGRR